IGTDMTGVDFSASLSPYCAPPEVTAPIAVPEAPGAPSTPSPSDGETPAAPHATPLSADAGPPQVLALTNGASAAQATLDGRGSIAPDEATFEWQDTGGNIVATGRVASIMVPVGNHDVRLVVRTDSATSDDTVNIRVVVGGEATIV